MNDQAQQQNQTPHDPETGEILETSVSVIQDGSIFDLFKKLNRGFFISDLEEITTEAAQMAINAKSKSEVVLKLTFAFDHKSEMMRVIPKLSKKVPEEPMKESFLFITPNGKLSGSDPRQHTMFPDKA